VASVLENAKPNRNMRAEVDGELAQGKSTFLFGEVCKRTRE